MRDIPVIYSDDDMLVINKPPGLTVHGGPSVRGETLVDFLLVHYPELRGVGEDPIRPGLVHRLDKDTSGVMVIARTQKSFEILKDLFKNRKIEKTYRAIVCGTPKNREGIISLPIGRLVSNPLKRGVEQKHSRIRGAREAITEYKVIKEMPPFSLVELRPKTGRMHQIRVHMKAIGHPVACDTVYGGKNVACPAGATRQLLHAQSLSFSLPGGKRMRFDADLPDDFGLIR